MDSTRILRARNFVFENTVFKRRFPCEQPLAVLAPTFVANVRDYLNNQFKNPLRQWVFELVPREGFEPPACGIEAHCSNPLSYRGIPNYFTFNNFHLSLNTSSYRM